MAANMITVEACIEAIIRLGVSIDQDDLEELQRELELSAEDQRESDCDSAASEREEDWAHGDDRGQDFSCDKHGVPYRPRYNDAGEPNFW